MSESAAGLITLLGLIGAVVVVFVLIVGVILKKD